MSTQPSLDTHEMCADILGGIEAAWAGAEMARSRMGDLLGQESFRAALTQQIGAPWVHFLSQLGRSLDVFPHALIIRSTCGTPSLAAVSAVIVGLGRPAASKATGFSDIFQEIRVREINSPDSRWHTDSANWRRPNDLTVLLCLRTTDQPAPTQLLPARQIFSELPDAHRAGLESTPVPWVLDGTDTNEVVEAPILEAGQVRFLRESIEQATTRVGGRRARELARLSALFAAHVDTLDQPYSAILDEGDILVFDNRQVMHRRGPTSPRDRNRIMLRAKVADPSWRH